jgi:hypothetical protein
MARASPTASSSLASLSRVRRAGPGHRDSARPRPSRVARCPAACAWRLSCPLRSMCSSNQPSALSPSNNWTGVTGMMVEIACL